MLLKAEKRSKLHKVSPLPYWQRGHRTKPRASFSAVQGTCRGAPVHEPPRGGLALRWCRPALSGGFLPSVCALVAKALASPAGGGSLSPCHCGNAAIGPVSFGGPRAEARGSPGSRWTRWFVCGGERQRPVGPLCRVEDSFEKPKCDHARQRGGSLLGGTLGDTRCTRHAVARTGRNHGVCVDGGWDRSR